MCFVRHAAFPVDRGCRGAERQQLAAEARRSERQLGRFRDGGPRAEHVVVPPLDGAQNLKAAAAEEIEIERQVAVHSADQRQALLERDRA